MQLASGDRHWRFTQNFTLSKARAQEHNMRTKSVKGATTAWYWFALAGGLVLVIAGLAYWLGRRHKDH